MPVGWSGHEGGITQSAVRVCSVDYVISRRTGKRGAQRKRLAGTPVRKSPPVFSLERVPLPLAQGRSRWERGFAAPLRYALARWAPPRGEKDFRGGAFS